MELVKTVGWADLPGEGLELIFPGKVGLIGGEAQVQSQLLSHCPPCQPWDGCVLTSQLT